MRIHSHSKGRIPQEFVLPDLCSLTHFGISFIFYSSQNELSQNSLVFLLLMHNLRFPGELFLILLRFFLYWRNSDLPSVQVVEFLFKELDGSRTTMTQSSRVGGCHCNLSLHGIESQTVESSQVKFRLFYNLSLLLSFMLSLNCVTRIMLKEEVYTKVSF